MQSVSSCLAYGCPAHTTLSQASQGQSSDFAQPLMMTLVSYKQLSRSRHIAAVE